MVRAGHYTPDRRTLCDGAPSKVSNELQPRLVLKHGSHLLLLNEAGNMPACNTAGLGLYHDDTRYLSQWELLVNGTPLTLVSCSVDHGYAGKFVYTNAEASGLKRRKLFVTRDVVLGDRLYERLAIRNLDSGPVEFDLEIKLQADYADMFELRGFARARRGQRMLPLHSPGRRRMSFAYRGVDGRLMETRLEFLNVRPDVIADGTAFCHMRLGAGEATDLEVAIRTELHDRHSPVWSLQLRQRIKNAAARVRSFRSNGRYGYASARRRADRRYSDWLARSARVETSDALLNQVLDRGIRDLYLLKQPTPGGEGLAAGIPWYCAVFGRDSIITALQMLPFMPDLAREVIEVLAYYQGRTCNAETEEEPGNILHELRLGELARSNQVPFTPYYGTVDATPLWLTLVCEYVDWTGDLDLVRRLWPNVVSALDFLARATNGGYLTYGSANARGLSNRGWKDSWDSIMYSDGKLAEPPIALCEVQSYLYEAWNKTARLARRLGHTALAADLEGKAARLKASFQKDFWMPDKGCVALALDAHGRRADVVSSNAGHTLASGILSAEQARAVADRLMSGDMFSGWGIRTLSASEVAYKPESYHDGSVWPHDNSIIAEGLGVTGHAASVGRIMRALLDVAGAQADRRLPELFCGYERQQSGGPVPYPVSCVPQAWAAGSMFQLLKACLNLRPDAASRCLRLACPSLPDWLEEVTVYGVRVGRHSVDLRFTTRSGQTRVEVLRKTRGFKVLVTGAVS